MLYNKCKSCGSTPSNKTPTAISASIQTIYNNRYNTGYNNGRVQGQNDVRNNPNGYGFYTGAQYNQNYTNGYNAGYNNGKNDTKIKEFGVFKSIKHENANALGDNRWANKNRFDLSSVINYKNIKLGINALVVISNLHSTQAGINYPVGPYNWSSGDQINISSDIWNNLNNKNYPQSASDPTRGVNAFKAFYHEQTGILNTILYSTGNINNIVVYCWGI